ncbi:MAG TPA: hypothetical protein VKT28_03270 [Puia sp.]|nr:hypothetical protein [Puia sp.]
MTLEELKSLKIGYVVVLNSGSPKMTVTEIENNYVKTKYWNEEKKLFNNHTADYAELRKTE